MFNVGDRVRVKSSQAVGIVQEVITQKQICVEFDQNEATRENFTDEELDLVPPGADLAASQLIHADL